MSGATKRLYPVCGRITSPERGEMALSCREERSREFADMAELHPGAARKIRGRLEGARLLTIGLEGMVFTL